MRKPLLVAGAAALLSGCFSKGLRPSEPVPVAPSAAAQSPSEPTASTSRPNQANAPVITPKPSEVTRTATKVFGDSVVEAPLIDVRILPEGPTWDIDVRSYETQERVAFYVNLFTQTSRTRFQERLRQGTRYEPMIRAKLKAGGIPEDMTYLALVESGYDPNAYSSAAAVGMWQFMSSTARDVGLRVDWWMDERRDPARATDAAIRFLRDLQNQFGSLYLAAAAYNGGPGRVSRGLTRFAEEMEGVAGEDQFFALAEQDYLRSETKNYVPQIIASALIGKEPARYGFQYDSLPLYMYDSIEVAAGTPLASVASAAGVSVGVIKELNPAILRGMVPPSGAAWIRIPYNADTLSESVRASLSAMSEAQRVGYSSFKSKGTETLASISANAGITSKQLAAYNPGIKTSRKGKVLAGQTVRVPTELTVAGATGALDPSIERYGSSTVAATRSGTVHIVKRGESLGRIASRYKISVARLKSLNGIRGDRVVAGQALRVRGTPVSRTTTAKASSAKSTKASASRSTSSRSTAAKSTASKSKSSASASKSTAKKSTAGKTTARKPSAKKPVAKKSATTKKAVATRR